MGGRSNGATAILGRRGFSRDLPCPPRSAPRAARPPRAFVLGAALIGAVLLGGLAPATPRSASAATVRLEVYDRDGARLSTAEFLAVIEAAPKGWRSDMTYRIADGTAVEQYPIYDLGGDPAFDTGEPGLGLSLAWKTQSTGYSTLFLDNAGAGFDSGGAVNFSYRAALDYRAKLDAALARRADFVSTPAFSALDAEASSLITAATAAGDEATRGALGQQALDALARAFETLLHDYGLQRARSQSLGEWWGVTIDRTNNYETVVDSVAAMVENVPGRAYARIVFDAGVPPGYYDGIVAAADAAGVVVVGQLLDSFYMSSISLAEVQARVQEYVDHFPGIQVWEIGNEVNGEWLGSQVAEKIEYMAAYVKSADPADTTVLTFFWQMGTAGEAASSLFQWISDEVSPALIADVDVVALSAWIGGAPLGIAHDEVFERLHALFPLQQIDMGELGYWSPGTTKAWWWRSEQNAQTTVRNALAEHMYLANLSFPYSGGGVFWWYYYQEMSGFGDLWQTVNEAYRSIYFCDDADSDGYCDFQDNCPGDANPDQADSDADGLGDLCDLACPDGDYLDVRSLRLQWDSGATDRLTVSAAFTTSAGLDPVSDGLALHLESAGAPPVTLQIGGSGAPLQFEDRGGRFRYRDLEGLVGGIVKVDLKPRGAAPGVYKLGIKGKNMDLGAAGGTQVRLLLDLVSTCVETHSSQLSCSLAGGGDKLRCR